MDWVANAYGSPKDAKQIIASGQALLLLDGLDELGTVRHKDPNDLVSEKYDPRERFLQQLPLNNQIVVTCRFENYEQLAIRAPLRGAVRLEPLNDAQINTYLKNQPDLLAFVYSEPQIKDWLDTPLLLSLFAFTYADMDYKDRKQFVRLKTQNDFRDNVFNDYLRRRIDHERAKYQIKGAEPDFSFDNVKHLLGQAATKALGGYKMHNSWSSDRGIEDDGSLIVESDFKNALPKNKVVAFLQYAKTLQLITETDEFLSTRTLSRERGYRFYHLLLRDFFVFDFSVNCLEQNPNGESTYDAASALGKLADKRALKALSRALESKYQMVQIAALHSLTGIGHPKASHQIEKALKDEDSIIRSRAIELLFHGKADNSNSQILIDMLDDQAEYVLKTVVYYIGEHKVVKAIPKLIGLFERAYDELTAFIRQALKEMAEHSIDLLIKALGHENPAIRGNSALTLGMLESVSVLDDLIPLLTDVDDDDDVRYKTAKALTWLGEPSLTLRISILSDTTHPNWIAMAHCHNMRAENEIASLMIHALASSEEEIVATATQFFQRAWYISEAVTPLIQLLHHTSRWVRYEAIQALKNYRDSDVIRALVKLIKQPILFRTKQIDGQRTIDDLDIQIEAIEALGETKNKGAAQALIQKLSSDHPTVVDMTIQALGELASKRATQPLISLLITTTDEEQQKKIAQALGKIRDRRAVEPLKKFLAEQIVETDIGRYLRTALAEIGTN